MMNDDLEKAEVELSETEKMVFYRYVNEDSGSGEAGDESNLLSEITFYFLDDNLMFSSVTPILYSVNMNDAHEFDTLSNLFTVSEMEELQPEVFTVAEMNVDGQTLKQLMVPSQPTAEQTDVMLNAFYLFTNEDEVIHYAVVLFMEVSQDFPTSSVLIFNSYFSWLKTTLRNALFSSSEHMFVMCRGNVL